VKTSQCRSCLFNKELAFEEKQTITIPPLLYLSNSNKITMSYQQFNNSRQPFRDFRCFRRAPEEHQHQHHQSRNGMKRSRDYSPPAFDCASDSSDNSSHQVTKRLRTLSCNDFPGMTSSNFNNSNSNNTNNHGGLFLTSKSDDEVSLAEEAQTAPTSLPHHSSFMQHKINHHYQQPIQIHQQQQQQQSHIGNHQAVSSSVNASSNVHSGNTSSRASGLTYATDYQPMNSLLGNLHLMRQQQQQRRRQISVVQTSQEQAQTRDHSAMVPQQQQQHGQQPQNQYHHHHRHLNGNHHSVPTTAPNAVASSGTNRSRKKTVSLRVNSNLY
jgi:hypothetical protein